MGQPVWSLIYAAFSDFYFIELLKLSCDHNVIIKTKSYSMLIYIALLFLLNTTESFKIYQLPSLVTMHYDSYLR